MLTDEGDITLEISKNRHSLINMLCWTLISLDPFKYPVVYFYEESITLSKMTMVSAGVLWNGKTHIHAIETT